MSRLPFTLGLAIVSLSLSLSAGAQSSSFANHFPRPEPTPISFTTPTPAAPSDIITVVAGDGYIGDSGNGGPATKAQFIAPQAVAVDSLGNIFIADYDGQVVRKVAAATGIISIYAGTGEGGYSGDKGLATEAELNEPGGLAVDPSNNLYISDERNNVIRKVTAKTGIITTAVGNGLGAGPTSGFIGECPAARIDNVLATESPLCSPIGLAVDSKGDIFFADFNNNVVRKVTAATGIITTVAGNGNEGYSGDGGPAVDASFFYPTSVALDKSGNLYITDAFNCAIRKVTVETGIITSIVGTLSSAGFNAVCGFAGDGGPASAAEIGSFAFALVVDKSGNIIFTDTGNNRVRTIEASSGKIYTLAGTTVLLPGNVQTSFGPTGDGGPAAYALLDYPTALALDAGGNLYIADTNNKEIRKVTSVAASPTATPEIAPASGAITESTKVTITAPVTGSTVYYTTDGSIPTTASTKYSAPFDIDKTSVITAFAAIPGQLSSPATIASYVDAPKPLISPASSSIPKPIKVTIKDGNPEAKIYYTLDGSTPYSGSTLYTGPITISSTTNIQAAALVVAPTPAGQQFFALSAPASATYTNPAAKAPTVVAEPATNITSTGATLNGRVTANDATTIVSFGFTISGSHSGDGVGDPILLTGTTQTAVSATTYPFALQPNTTYNFQVSATNAKGYTTSNTLTFTTKPAN